MNRLSTVLAAIVALTALSLAPARAHHSHAMFDLDAEKTISGTVKAFAFTNPHVYLYVDVTDRDSSATTTWLVEMDHVQNMINRGIRASTFKIGDKLTVTVNPLRDGRPGGVYVSITTASGKKYGSRAEAAAALAPERARAARER